MPVYNLLDDKRLFSLKFRKQDAEPFAILNNST